MAINWNNKNVLITGVSGFAGAYLARDLLDKGANIYGMVRRRADGSIPRSISHKNIDTAISYVEANLEDICGMANVIDQADPDYIFHLAAQSFVPRSFAHPIETAHMNGIGTNNLLEAVRLKGADPILVFAGSSEEYGLVISSEKQYAEVKKTYGALFPEPLSIPEVPIKETNPLRPMSPYAVSKVYGDFLFRNYYHTYGLKTVVSRAFNHEGAGRGIQFVTSVITSQVSRFRSGELDQITIGNVNAFRDWSHILDIINGYEIIAEKGNYGDVYNQGSCRTTSVLSYILYSIQAAGYDIQSLSTMESKKTISDPLQEDSDPLYGVSFIKPKIDRMILDDEISFSCDDGGILVKTSGKDIPIRFDQNRFRPSEVPILFANCDKLKSLGFNVKYTISDIVRDQLNYYMDHQNRASLHV